MITRKPTRNRRSQPIITGAELLQLLGYSSQRTFLRHRKNGQLKAPLYASPNAASRVYAVRDELEAWLVKNPQPKTRPYKSRRKPAMTQ